MPPISRRTRVRLCGTPRPSAGGDATIVEGATYSSHGVFTDLDSSQWTATVNYGDGGGFQPLALNPLTLINNGAGRNPTATGTFNLDHSYVAAGAYTVTVDVTDDSWPPVQPSLLFTSPPLPQLSNTDVHITPNVIDEDQSVSLTGKFTDASIDTLSSSHHLG